MSLDREQQLFIKSVKVEESPILSIEVSDSRLYKSNFSMFKAVHCFPKNQEEWKKVSITAHGYNLTWNCGFEVHVGQVIGRSFLTVPAEEGFDPQILKIEVNEKYLTAFLDNGLTKSVEIDKFPRLKGANQEQRDKYEIIGYKSGVHWPDLDEDISVRAFLR